eukprot:g45855.t1
MSLTSVKDATKTFFLWCLVIVKGFGLAAQVATSDLTSLRLKMEAKDIVSQLDSFRKIRNISTEGILAVTIQRNRTAAFCSVMIDFKAKKLLPNYPAELCNSYKETKVGDFNVCYAANLQAIAVPTKAPYEFEGAFCCHGITEYKSKQISRQRMFDDFVQGRGKYPNYVFEVTQQQDLGAVNSKLFFQLISGQRVRRNGPYTSKVHSFKNYKCTRHGLLFGVDLYNMVEQEGYNYHHMRLNPFQHINESVLRDFFQAAGQGSRLPLQVQQKAPKTFVAEVSDEPETTLPNTEPTHGKEI